jgi:hypothetical protein
MPYKKILLDESKNLDLENQGYAVIPFLNLNEIKELTDFFYEKHADLPAGMYASSHASDIELRKEMNDEIQRVCKRAVDVSFRNAQTLGATFMAKSKGENGGIHPHQDWSIVNEEEFFSYNVWLPLVDTSLKNGTLLLLPKSHELLKNTRGLHIPSSFESVNEEVWNYLVPINMKAGEALVYDHRMLHASGLNQTDTPRLVIVYGIIPENATMRYYFGRGDLIEEYECSPDYYFNENILQEPQSLKLLRSNKNQNPSIDLGILKRNYENKTSFFDRFLSLIFK